MSDLIDVIRQYIATEIMRGPTSALRDDDELIGQGLMTSLDVVELVVFLEERFGVEIPPEDVVEEQFATVRDIAELITRRRDARDAA